MKLRNIELSIGWGIAITAFLYRWNAARSDNLFSGDMVWIFCMLLLVCGSFIYLRPLSLPNLSLHHRFAFVALNGGGLLFWLVIFGEEWGTRIAKWESTFAWIAIAALLASAWYLRIKWTFEATASKPENQQNINGAESE